MNSDTKTCRKCNAELPLYKFNKKQDTKDGYNNACKDCRRTARGSSKRRPQSIRHYTPVVTLETLIEDVLELSRRYPTSLIYRNAAKRLLDDPEWQHSQEVADLLYDCWEKRMKYEHDFEALEAKYPTEKEQTAKVRGYKNSSLSPLEENGLI